MAGWYILEEILKRPTQPNFLDLQTEKLLRRKYKSMDIDIKIEITKLIQRIFDNCSESESPGGDGFKSQLCIEDITFAIERTLDDLVNEKLRNESGN